MALDGSYDGLKASIADFLNRSDLTTAIPDFIRMAEAQMTRRFAGRQRQGLPVPRRLIQQHSVQCGRLAAGAAAIPGRFRL